MSTVTHTLDTDIVASDGVFAAVMLKALDYLRAEDALAPVRHMFTEDSGTLAADLDRALTGTEPISIMASIGEASDAAPGVPNVIHLDPVEVVLTVIERPQLRNGLTCNRVCELVARTLKCARIDNAFLASPAFRTPALEFGEAVAKSIVFRLSAVIS